MLEQEKMVEEEVPLPNIEEPEGPPVEETLSPGEEELYHEFLDTQAEREECARGHKNTFVEEVALEEDIREFVFFEVELTKEKKRHSRQSAREFMPVRSARNGARTTQALCQ